MDREIILPEEIKVADSNLKVDITFTDICICHPPLQMNRTLDHIYTTYDLGAICPHCKAPFRECKPELLEHNRKIELDIINKSF
jgi:hypothetical protein